MRDSSTDRREAMTKEVLVKDDGRYLIYYRFQTGQDEVKKAPDVCRAAASCASPSLTGPNNK